MRLWAPVAVVTALVVMPLGSTAPLPEPTDHTRAPASSTGGPAGGAEVSYAPPISPLRVVRPFQAPATPYGPGHRGVDLASPRHAAVRTAAGGVVSFAGQVAGRGVVVVAHPDGVRTEYEPVRPEVTAGQSVRPGEVIGIVDGRHGTCPPDACLHWGARRGDTYFDPLLLLQPLGTVRLLPWTRARGP